MDEEKFEKLIEKLREELTRKQASRLAAEMVACAFVWSASEEGHEYWHDVVENLASKSFSEEI